MRVFFLGETLSAVGGFDLARFTRLTQNVGKSADHRLGSPADFPTTVALIGYPVPTAKVLVAKYCRLTVLCIGHIVVFSLLLSSTDRTHHDNPLRYDACYDRSFKIYHCLAYFLLIDGIP